MFPPFSGRKLGFGANLPWACVTSHEVAAMAKEELIPMGTNSRSLKQCRLGLETH